MKAGHNISETVEVKALVGQETQVVSEDHERMRKSGKIKRE